MSDHQWTDVHGGLQFLFTLKNCCSTHHRGLVRFRISDRKFVNHTTEMILWSMILTLLTSTLLPYKNEHDKLSEIIYWTTSYYRKSANFLLDIQNINRELLLKFHTLYLDLDLEIHWAPAPSLVVHLSSPRVEIHTLDLWLMERRHEDNY